MSSCEVLTSDEALALPKKPDKLVVIGGGYIAVEFAGYFHGYGTEVHLVFRQDLPLRGFDEDIREHLLELTKAKGIHVHSGENPLSIEAGSYLLDGGAERRAFFWRRLLKTDSGGVQDLAKPRAVPPAFTSPRNSENAHAGILATRFYHSDPREDQCYRNLYASERMLIVRWKTSGNIVVCLDAEQYHALVLRGGSNVRTLKRHLCSVTGCPRFRQRLFDEASGAQLHELPDSCTFGFPAVLSFLVKGFVQSDKERYDELLHAAEGHRHRDLERLLQQPQSPDLVDDTWLWSALHGACYWNSLECIRLLLEARAYINAVSIYSPELFDSGATPLVIAAHRGHNRAVALLISAEADLNLATANGWTAMLIAASDADRDIMQQLLLARADVDKPTAQGTSPLLAASQHGHMGVVQMMLQAKADPDRAAQEGSTPVHVASHMGHRKTVQLLAQARADLNKVDTDGATALFLAAREGHVRIVQLLIESGAEMNIANAKCHTPLYAASELGQTDVVQCLIEAAADLNKASVDSGTPLSVACLFLSLPHSSIQKKLLRARADANGADGLGVCALHAAAAHGHCEAASFLLQARAELDRPTANGTTPLLAAASAPLHSNGGDVTDLLIQARADFNLPSPSGETPIFVASSQGNERVVNFLLLARADIEKSGDGKLTPIFIAVHFGHTKIVQMLLHAKAKLDIRREKLTPLMFASLRGHCDVAKQLIDASANLEQSGDGGETALSLAARKGHHPVVQQLIARRAQLDKEAENAATALSIAACRGDHKIVQELLQAQALVNKTNGNGATAVFFAAQEGHLRVVQLLIQARATLDQVAENGATALSIAACKGHLKIVHQLIQAGARVEKHVCLAFLSPGLKGLAKAQ
ncbi:ANKRD50 [Symbiodinium natans]|uniref:ANKRD50 protein n=1 Tax=Symbiodinium natans TaxID=878477 RepID=A0A812L7T0_9DINO|nr:ANKRD50 [Symbiodinium natans]